MKFSLIIPTINEADNIQACLSALQSLRRDCELIVVDGGSKDNTVVLAKGLADQILNSPQGRAKQMNVGAQHAHGDILLFLHADTFLPGNALALIDRNIDSTRQWGRFDIQLEGRYVMLKVIAQLMNWRSRLTGIATGDQVIFVTKEAFAAAGQFPDIALMEDIALCSKLLKLTPPVCLKAKVRSSGRRWEAFGIYKTILLMWSLRLRYWLGTDPRHLSALYRVGKFWLH